MSQKEYKSKNENADEWPRIGISFPEFMRSCGSSDYEKARKLIEFHSDLINQTEPETGKTPLHRAAGYGRTETCKLLISKRASFETDIDGKTALYDAVQHGRLETCKLLLKNRAIFQTDKTGKTPLFIAAQCGRLEICKLLLKHNATFKPDDEGKTPFLAAARSDHYEICKLFLDSGVDIEEKNDVYRSPIKNMLKKIRKTLKGIKFIAQKQYETYTNIHHRHPYQRSTISHHLGHSFYQ